MYAIIEIKGRQLIVREGDVVRIPYDGELESGKTVKADRVLLVEFPVPFLFVRRSGH